jgi:Ser/Thr protein kinase RdoA (MazF antagonist)
VVHSARLVAIARPDLADLCNALAARFAAGPPGPVDEVLLHGDVHPGNALLDGDRINLIDLDQSGIGAAAADIGSLAARLRYRDILDDGDERAGASMFAAFAAGYESLRPLPHPAVLRWHTAAALVAERAIRAVNRVHRDALPYLDEVLTHALRLLEGSDDGC